MNRFKKRPSVPARRRSSPSPPYHHQDCHATIVSGLAMTLKKMLKDELGQVLPMVPVLLALVILFLFPVIALTNTNLRAINIVRENDLELYAADAGIQYAYYKFAHDTEFEPETDPLPTYLPYTVNGCDVSLAKVYLGDFIYKITSTACNPTWDPECKNPTTIEAYFRVSESQYESGSSPFDYAVVTLNGDLTMTGSSRISSDCSPKPCNEGDVWVNGNINLGWSNIIEGDAKLTGTCNRPGNIQGVYQPGADPPERPTWLDDKINEFIARTQVSEPACSGPVYSSWKQGPGTYGAMQITGNMTIEGTGTYTFTGPVCVGGNLVIQRGPNFVTFNAPVRVNGYAQLIGNGTVLFNDTLYVGGYLQCQASRSARFKEKVTVNGQQRCRVSGRDYIVYFDGSKYSGVAWDVTFDNTLRAVETPNTSECYLVRFGSGRTYTFEDVIYTSEKLVFDGAASTLNFGKAIVASCDINISNGAKALSSSVDKMPFYISTHGGVNLTGGIQAMALVYAPDGQAYVDGSSKLDGAIAAKTALLSGDIRLIYPVLLRERDDIHPGEGGSSPGESSVSIISYSIK